MPRNKTPQKKNKKTPQKKNKKTPQKKNKKKTNTAKGNINWFKRNFTRRQPNKTKAWLIQENNKLNKGLNECIMQKNFYKDRINEIASVIMNDNRFKKIAKLRNLFATKQEQLFKQEYDEEDDILMSSENEFIKSPNVSPEILDALRDAQSISPRTFEQIRQAEEKEALREPEEKEANALRDAQSISQRTFEQIRQAEEKEAKAKKALREPEEKQANALRDAQSISPRTLKQITQAEEKEAKAKEALRDAPNISPGMFKELEEAKAKEAKAKKH